jgi:hypothetical protein
MELSDASIIILKKVAQSTVKPLYSEHQRDRPKSVHYRRCSFYGGFTLTEPLHIYSACPCKNLYKFNDLTKKDVTFLTMKTY